MGNQEWTFQRNKQHWAHQIQDGRQNKKQQKRNTAQYMLDTTIRKQVQIT